MAGAAIVPDRHGTGNPSVRCRARRRRVRRCVATAEGADGGPDRVRDQRPGSGRGPLTLWLRMAKLVRMSRMAGSSNSRPSTVAS